MTLMLICLFSGPYQESMSHELMTTYKHLHGQDLYNVRRDVHMENMAVPVKSMQASHSTERSNVFICADGLE
jgi:hypothetical protein